MTIRRVFRCKKTQPPTAASESQIQKAILKHLQLKGYWCWRNNSGAVQTGEVGNKRFLRLSPKGSPDILGVFPGGVLFGLEVKTATGKQNDNQIKWQSKATSYGVRYAVVRSREEALFRVATWGMELRGIEL